MFSLNILKVVLFVRIVQLGSLAKAADSMRISRPSATRHLQETEQLLKVSLVKRTTRALGITQAGTLVYEAFSGMIVSLDSLWESLTLEEGQSPPRTRRPRKALELALPVLMEQSLAPMSAGEMKS